MTSAQARDYTVDLESLHQYLREEMAVGDKQTVMVCLYTYISIKRRYSRVTITIVPSVACQHTEGEYHLLTTTYTY